jgi:hypothetical protein
VLAEHLHALSGESVMTPVFRGALHWPRATRLRDGWGACRRRLSQWLCGMHGHERHLHGAGGHLTLRCAFCGHEAPGWDIGAPRLARRLDGDPDRHRLARASQQVIGAGAAGEVVASARVRAARAAIAQERQGLGGSVPPAPPAPQRREPAGAPDRMPRSAAPAPRPSRPEEDPVSDRSMVLGTLVVGAVVGSMVGYLLFTEDGRKSMGALEQWVDDMLHEAERLSRIAARTGQAANQLMDEWKNVQGSMGGGSQVRH